MGAPCKEAIDAGEYSVNELVALSHLDIPGLDIEGEGAFDREALANITLAPPTDAEILQPEHLGPGLLNFVEIPKPPEELDALLRGDIDPELYGRHVHDQGGTPEQMSVPVDDLRNQLPTRMPDGPAPAPASLTQAWNPLATPLDRVSRSHPSDPRIATNDLAVPPGAAIRHGTNERQGGVPQQGAPYPPTTGDPIADRAIQLTQGQFQQPNVLPTGQFDHAGFGQQAIRETLARLTGQRIDRQRLSVENLDHSLARSNFPELLGGKEGNKVAQDAMQSAGFLDRIGQLFGSGETQTDEPQGLSDDDRVILQKLHDHPDTTETEKRILKRLIESGRPVKRAKDPENRDLESAFIPGRIDPETGEVERVEREDYDVIAYILADRVVKNVSRRSRISMDDPKGRDPRDGTDGNAALTIAKPEPRGGEIELLIARLNRTERKSTVPHEVGHLIDFRSEENPTENSRDGLLSDPEVQEKLIEISKAHRGRIEDYERKNRLSSRELLADAFAMYMKDPEEFKKKWPKIARMLRDLVNDDPILGRVITFARKEEGNESQGSISFA